MEIFLVLVVAVVYAPLLLLLWVARKDSRPSLDMDHSARNAFWHGASNTSIKVASLNIRYSPANQQPNQPGNTWQEYPWVYRREAMLDQVLYEMPNILCLQEVMHHQLQDIDKVLGSIYGHVAAGREDGEKKGEATPIFWNKQLFELVSYEHFWLSDKPHVPGSVGWDAALCRIATLVKLRWRTPKNTSTPAGDAKTEGDKEAGEVFYVLNTHYDHMGLKAREESSKLVLFKLRHLMEGHDGKDGGRPPLVIMTGDLNSVPQEEGYQTITGHRYVNSKNGGIDYKRGDKHAFYDTRHEMMRRGAESSIPLPRIQYGENGTFTDFINPMTPLNRRPYAAYVIDFILVADNGAVHSLDEDGRSSSKRKADAHSWAVVRYGVLPNWFEDGQYSFRLSDHNMVTALLSRAG